MLLGNFQIFVTYHDHSNGLVPQFSHKSLKLTIGPRPHSYDMQNNYKITKRSCILENGISLESPLCALLNGPIII